MHCYTNTKQLFIALTVGLLMWRKHLYPVSSQGCSFPLRQHGSVITVILNGSSSTTHITLGTRVTTAHKYIYGMYWYLSNALALALTVPSWTFLCSSSHYSRWTFLFFRGFAANFSTSNLSLYTIPFRSSAAKSLLRFSIWGLTSYLVCQCCC